MSDWTWDIPPSDVYANSSAWSVRFNIHFSSTPPVEDSRPGDRALYIPGQRLQLTSDPAGPDMRTQGLDAVAAGAFHAARSFLKLTTPLGGGLATVRHSREIVDALA